jgi:CRP/FNR family transcriptional activator FtrB
MTKVKAGAELLRSIPLFNKVSEANFAELMAAASLRHFPSRTVLFNEGDSASNLYILIRGAVELFSEQGERRVTTAVVRTVRPLVLYAVLADQSPLSARTLEESQILAVPAKLVLNLFARDQGFADAAIAELASECREVVEDLKSQRLRTTTERVAHWMLRCDSRNGATGQFTIPFDKRVLASYLGMAPEHLSRSFSALAAVGVVVEGRSITLTDRVALSEAAGLELPE